MRLFGDFHTHTRYSDGKGSVQDNIEAAKSAGLVHLAITEHGFGHTISGISKKNFQREYDELKGTDTLFGIEANLIGMDGALDIDEEHLEMLDILVAGFHLTPFGAKFSDNFKLILPGWVSQIKNPSKKRVEKNTEAYINMIKRYPVDIISHPAYILKLDYFKLAKTAEEYGTFIEISSRHHNLTEENLKEMLKTDCKFVLNSDAHLPENIGKVDYAVRMVEALKIPRERIVNAYEELPKFRLKASRQKR